MQLDVIVLSLIAGFLIFVGTAHLGIKCLTYNWIEQRRYRRMVEAHLRRLGL
jgi:hypothetical protein